MKKCSKCKVEKPFKEFSKCKRNKDGLQGYCKTCDNITRRKNYYANHENERSKRKEQYGKNKKRYIQQSIIYQRIKYKTNPSFNIRMRLSNRIREVLKSSYTTKTNKTIGYLGISLSEFKNHLEKQFYVNKKTGEMMSWSNMGKWHIDHIIPCYSYDLTKVEAQKKCFHYTNLRPMWAEENLKKGSKFII